MSPHELPRPPRSAHLGLWSGGSGCRRNWLVVDGMVVMRLAVGSRGFAGYSSTYDQPHEYSGTSDAVMLLFLRRNSMPIGSTIWTDRVGHIDVGDGARMAVPVDDWLWQMNHVRLEPDRGTKCDDRMLAVGVIESYLYLIQECTKEEAWRRIKILRDALSERQHTLATTSPHPS